MTTLADGRSAVRAPRVTGIGALQYLPAAAFAIDACAALVSILLAAVARRELGVFGSSGPPSLDVAVIVPLLLAAWLGLVALFGGYTTSVFGAGSDEYRRVLNASLTTAGLVGVACFLLGYDLSRWFFVMAFAIGVPAVLLGRFMLRRAVRQAHRRGALLHRVIIAGTPVHVDEIAAVLRRESWLGYQVVGALTPEYYLDEETRSGIPVLGNSDEAPSVVRDCRADILFIASGALSSPTQMRRIAWDLEHENVQVVVAPSITDVSGERVRVRPVGGLPLVHIDPPRATDASRWGKRLFDLVGSAGLILAFGPVFLVAALQIRLHDRGPVLFRQTRVGHDGQEFPCLKFRTMVVDAEARLAELHVEVGYEGGLFKLKDDPRITEPGRWLRRFSVDELPQLFNVFRGQMSLVGPRPPLPLEVAGYEADTIRRLRVRPGMTGLWQVSGRSDLSWSEAVRLDLYYVDNWSMMQDLSILAKTFGAVFGSRGAY